MARWGPQVTFHSGLWSAWPCSSRARGDRAPTHPPAWVPGSRRPRPAGLGLAKETACPPVWAPPGTGRGGAQTWALQRSLPCLLGSPGRGGGPPGGPPRRSHSAPADSEFSVVLDKGPADSAAGPTGGRRPASGPAGRHQAGGHLYRDSVAVWGRRATGVHVGDRAPRVHGPGVPGPVEGRSRCLQSTAHSRKPGPRCCPSAWRRRLPRGCALGAPLLVLTAPPMGRCGWAPRLRCGRGRLPPRSGRLSEHPAAFPPGSLWRPFFKKRLTYHLEAGEEGGHRDTSVGHLPSTPAGPWPGLQAGRRSGTAPRLPSGLLGEIPTLCGHLHGEPEDVCVPGRHHSRSRSPPIPAAPGPRPLGPACRPSASRHTRG